MSVLIKQISGSNKLYTVASINSSIVSELQHSGKISYKDIDMILSKHRGDEIDLCVELLNRFYYTSLNRDLVYAKIYKYAPCILDKWIDCDDLTACIWFKKIFNKGEKKITIVSLNWDDEITKDLDIISFMDLSSFELIQLSYYSGLHLLEMNKDLFNPIEYKEALGLSEIKLHVKELPFKGTLLNGKDKDDLNRIYNFVDLLSSLICSLDSVGSSSRVLDFICSRPYGHMDITQLTSLFLNILLYCSDKRMYLYSIFNDGRYLWNVGERLSLEELKYSTIYLIPFDIDNKLVKLITYGPDDLNERIKLKDLTSTNILDLSKVINIPVSLMNEKLFNDFQYNIALGKQCDNLLLL